MSSRGPLCLDTNDVSRRAQSCLDATRLCLDKRPKRQTYSSRATGSVSRRADFCLDADFRGSPRCPKQKAFRYSYKMGVCRLGAAGVGWGGVG